MVFEKCSHAVVCKDGVRTHDECFSKQGAALTREVEESSCGNQANQRMSGGEAVIVPAFLTGIATDTAGDEFLVIALYQRPLDASPCIDR